MRNIKIILEFDGTGFHGWQAQSGTGQRTVQEEVERAISRLAGEKVKATSSGRTDAGVHAFGLVANFRTAREIPATAWAPALNRLLPGDVRVIVSEQVPDEFHARFSARGKVYRYLVLNAHEPTAIFRDHAWHVAKPLRMKIMRDAAKSLLGRRDFSSFRASQCGAESPIRTLRSIEIRKRGAFIEFTLEADAFLMHMARNIVGTLIEAGLGRFTREDVKRILRARSRSAAGIVAPPQGLYLMHVFYPRKMAEKGRLRKSVTKKSTFSLLQKSRQERSLKYQ